MKNILYAIITTAFVLFASCNEYDMKEAAPDSTFLTGITIGYYDATVTSNTHGKQIIASQQFEYDYFYKDTVIDSVFISQAAATAASFKLSDAWVALSVGNGSVERVKNAPKLGIPGDFSNPVYYNIKSVYGEEKLYKIIFKIK